MTSDLFGYEHPDSPSRRGGIGSHHSAASQTDEWITPRPLLDVLGHFDLDPCSPVPERRPWPTADRHYTVEDDGLRRDWRGRVWLNPPYTDAAPWLARLADHGDGLALIFARTETATWFDYVWDRAAGILFLRGRLTFCRVDGTPAPHNSGAPSALIAYSPADARLLAGLPWPGRYVDLPKDPG